MGKRELLIVAIFVAVGVAAYELSAPARTGQPSRFTLASAVARFRSGVRGNPAAASVTTSGSIPTSGALAEIRVSNAAHVTITGGNEPDIAYELTVDANGPDEATARRLATATALVHDRVGLALLVRVDAPPNTRQSARVVLRVPSRLAVFVDGAASGTETTVAHVASLHLESVVGDAHASEIAGAVTGSERNGTVTVTGAGSVRLALVSARATIEGVRGAVSLTGRNGRTEILGAAGDVDLDATNQDTTVSDASGSLRLTGSGGRVRVENARGRVSVDMRRTTVDIAAPHAAGITALTTDAPLRVTVAAPLDAAIDAVATDGGTIDATDFSLAATTTGDETRVSRTFGAGSSAIALRNQRAPIVIGRLK